MERSSPFFEPKPRFSLQRPMTLIVPRTERTPIKKSTNYFFPINKDFKETIPDEEFSPEIMKKQVIWDPKIFGVEYESEELEKPIDQDSLSNSSHSSGHENYDE